MVRTYKRKTADRWSKEDLLEALTSIKNGGMKMDEASKRFGISRATLYRQYKKFLVTGSRADVEQFKVCGGSSILRRQEELTLVSTIEGMEDKGMTVSPNDIKRICYEYCNVNGIPNMFNDEKKTASDDWYYGFRKRHPNFRLAADMPKLSKPSSIRGKSEEGEGSSTSVGGDSDDACPTLSAEVSLESSTSNDSNMDMDSSSQSSVDVNNRDENEAEAFRTPPQIITASPIRNNDKPRDDVILISLRSSSVNQPLQITTSGEQGPVIMTIRSEYDKDEEMGVWPNGETMKDGAKKSENMETDGDVGEGTGGDKDNTMTGDGEESGKEDNGNDIEIKRLDVVAEGTGADVEGVNGDQEDMDMETDESEDDDTDSEEGEEEEDTETDEGGDEKIVVNDADGLEDEDEVGKGNKEEEKQVDDDDEDVSEEEDEEEDEDSEEEVEDEVDENDTEGSEEEEEMDEQEESDSEEDDNKTTEIAENKSKDNENVGGN